jgi:hypothetical protein
MMQSDWDIKSRAHACSRSGREFSEGEFFYTMLVREGEGFRREDLCEEAWRERNDNIEPFSFWRSKYEPPAPPPQGPIAKNDAEGLLRKLIEENDPSRVNPRYILALMLERKRVLRPMVSSDADMLVYEFAGTGETIVLQNPRLGFDRIPDVQLEVAEMLGSGM